MEKSFQRRYPNEELNRVSQTDTHRAAFFRGLNLSLECHRWIRSPVDPLSGTGFALTLRRGFNARIGLLSDDKSFKQEIRQKIRLRPKF